MPHSITFQGFKLEVRIKNRKTSVCSEKRYSDYRILKNSIYVHSSKDIYCKCEALKILESFNFETLFRKNDFDFGMDFNN